MRVILFVMQLACIVSYRMNGVCEMLTLKTDVAYAVLRDKE